MAARTCAVVSNAPTSPPEGSGSCARLVCNVCARRLSTDTTRDAARPEVGPEAAPEAAPP